MLNLDTHILIFALQDTLTVKERKLLRREPWCISPIVLWEISKLESLGRIQIELDSIEFSRLIGQLEILPLTLSICRLSTELDFSSDPADELIAATSLAHKIPLVTRDKKILRSKIVPFAV